MKLIKYLIPLWIGVLFYTTMTMCFGAKGFSAYGQLETEMKKEMVNINSLVSINNDLANTRDVLLSDKNNLHVYARELGYAAPGEHFIRIIGLGSGHKNQSSPGHIISPVSPNYIPDRILQILSFILALTALFSLGVYDFLKFLKEREAGLPIIKTNYDGIRGKLHALGRVP